VLLIRNVSFLFVHWQVRSDQIASSHLWRRFIHRELVRLNDKIRFTASTEEYIFNAHQPSDLFPAGLLIKMEDETKIITLTKQRKKWTWT